MTGQRCLLWGSAVEELEPGVAVGFHQFAGFRAVDKPFSFSSATCSFSFPTTPAEQGAALASSALGTHWP